jgi:hypothetical protein
VYDIAAFHAVVIEEIQTVVKGMLIHTWAKLDYELDVIRTTLGFPFVGRCVHKLFELGSSLQKTANAVCFGYQYYVFKTGTGHFWTSSVLRLQVVKAISLGAWTGC